MRLFLAIVFVGLAGMMNIKADEQSSTLRVGFIGLDSSHCIAFTELLQREGNAGDLAGVKIVAAYPGGNPEFPLSRDRVQGYTEKMKSLGVQIVDSIDGLFPLVDAIILGSVDGSQHLEQVEPVFKAGKPVFIDKPLAHNLADALKIQSLGRQYKTPWFSASGIAISERVAATDGQRRAGGCRGL